MLMLPDKILFILAFDRSSLLEVATRRNDSALEGRVVISQTIKPASIRILGDPTLLQRASRPDPTLTQGKLSGSVQRHIIKG